MEKNLKVLVNNRSITLSQTNYKSAGGEGSIYVKDGIGFKIYHDIKKTIPIDKISELKKINLQHVLTPIDVVYDYNTNQPIGFTLNFLDNIQYLCKLFVKSFKDRNNISQQMIVDIVKFMQKTLKEIHKHNILVVDYNEMNFLIDNSFKTVFHIDTDSYQTQHYKATALMESVRDRTNKKFNEGTDWFSFAIVSFQLYIGTHPYKGRHPDYSPKEISKLKMMDDGISVFHKDVTLPPNCNDLSVIPKSHLEWYKKVFLKNERSIPPLADEIQIAIAKQNIVIGNDSFLVEKLFSLNSAIKDVKYFNGLKYLLTDKEIYEEKKLIYTSQIKNEVSEIGFAYNQLIVIKFNNNVLTFETIQKNILCTINAQNFMELNGLIYSINNNTVLENGLTQIGNRLVHHTQIVCNIFHNYKVFKGVIIQDILGECRLAIPYKQQTCINIHVKELDGYRIIDAKYEKRFCIILAEKNGNYRRFIVNFNESHDIYSIRIDDGDIDEINFTVKENGLCILLVGFEKLEAFFNNDKIKVLKNPPIDSTMKLFNDNNKVMIIDNKTVYSVTLK